MQTDFLEEVKNHSPSTNTETIQDAWDRAQPGIIAAGRGVLCISKGGSIIDKETWWWNAKVQEMTCEKKVVFKKCQQFNSPKDRLEYIVAKRASK